MNPGVREQGVAQHVEVLAVSPHAERPLPIKGVIKRPVVGLRVVPSPLQAFEVGIGGRDGPKVLGTVEPPPAVILVAGQAHRNQPPAATLGELVLVVEAVPPLLVLLKVLVRLSGRNTAVPVSSSSTMPAAPSRA